MPESEQTNSECDLQTPISDLEEMAIDNSLRASPEFYKTHEARIELIDRLLDDIEPVIGETWYIVSAEWMSLFHNSVSTCSFRFGNLDIIDPNTNQLVVTEDLSKFHAVPKIVWQYLVAWYDPNGTVNKTYFEIPRNVVEGNGDPTIDFYPAIVSVKLFTRIPGFAKHSTKLISPKNTTLGELFANLCDDLGISPGYQMRLWIVESSPAGRLVFNSPSALAQAPFNVLQKAMVPDSPDAELDELYSDSNGGDLLLVLELKDSTGTWPSDSIGSPIMVSQSNKSTIANRLAIGPANSDDEMTEELHSSSSNTPEPPLGPAPPVGYANNYQPPLPVKACDSGTIGLVNLGNTCYMNSALQCLTHVPELANYFLSGYYRNEINRDNPIGYEGRIAEAFGKLLDSLLGRDSSGTSYSCRPFRSVIGHYNSVFGGYQQQDSQEFLAFLLDGLHEDLNRIIKKPATEKPELRDEDANNIQAISKLADESWKRHRLRNDSVIVDLFTGLYKSTIVCPICSLTSVTFDPFTDLTLPVPSNQVFSRDMKIFPKDRKPIMLAVEIDNNSTMADLRKYIAQHCDVNPDCLMFVDVFQNSFYKNTPEGPVCQHYSTNDDIYAYELEYPPGQPIPEFDSDGEKNPLAGQFPFPVSVYIYVAESENDSGSCVDVPFYITLAPSEAANCKVILSKIIAQMYNFTQFEQLLQVIEALKQPNVDLETFHVFAPYVAYPTSHSLGSKPFSGSSIGPQILLTKRVEQMEIARMQVNRQPPPVPPRHNLPNYGQTANPPPYYQNSQYDSQYEENNGEDDEEEEDVADIGSDYQNTRVSSGYSDFMDNPLSGSRMADYQQFDNMATGVDEAGHDHELSDFTSSTSESSQDEIIKSNLDSPEDDVEPNQKPKPKQGLLGGSGGPVPSDDEAEDLDVKADSNKIEADDHSGIASTLAPIEESSSKPPALPPRVNVSNADPYATRNIPAYGSLHGQDDGDVDSAGVNVNDDELDSSSSESVDMDIGSPGADSSSSQLDNAIQLDDDSNDFYGNTTQFSGNNNYGPNQYARNTSQGFTRDPADINNQLIVGPSGLLLVKFTKTIYEQCTESLTAQNFYDIVVPPEAAKIREVRAERLRNRHQEVTSLDHCLDQFSKTEVLGEEDLWYCSTCKAHQRASKTIELWKTPDIFVIHLKRFSSFGAYNEKINTTVEFPIDGLDITNRVHSTKANLRFGGKLEDGVLVYKEDEEIVYDLFGVDNHYGTLHGGHYTAYVKNFVDDKWYYFDDSRVRPADPNDSIAGSAYLLFYRRRGSIPLGGENMKSIWGEILERRKAIDEEELVKRQASIMQRGSSTNTASGGTFGTTNRAPGNSSFSGTGRPLNSRNLGHGSSDDSSNSNSQEASDNEHHSLVVYGVNDSRVADAKIYDDDDDDDDDISQDENSIQDARWGGASLVDDVDVDGEPARSGLNEVRQCFSEPSHSVEVAHLEHVPDSTVEDNGRISRPTSDISVDSGEYVDAGLELARHKINSHTMDLEDCESNESNESNGSMSSAVVVSYSNANSSTKGESGSDNSSNGGDSEFVTKPKEDENPEKQS